MFGKESNDSVMAKCISILAESDNTEDSHIVIIERVASYGMAVGSEVFETCEWIGRFAQELGHYAPIGYVYRRDEKKYICGSPTANDAAIRRALADRFAYGEPNYGKGTKANPGFFYGFFGFFYGKDYISIIVKAIPGPSGHHLLELPAVIGLERLPDSRCGYILITPPDLVYLEVRIQIVHLDILLLHLE